MRIVIGIGFALAFAAWAVFLARPGETPSKVEPSRGPRVGYESAKKFDLGGLPTITTRMKPWSYGASFEELAEAFNRAGYRFAEEYDRRLGAPKVSASAVAEMLFMKAIGLNNEGEANAAYEVLQEALARAESDPEADREWHFTIVHALGATALRRGENDNCIMCRGESSCIIPISEAARHLHPEGSRLAVQHFTEYLEQFPDDMGVRWLLNVAHMTLGEHPDGVDPKYLNSLDRWCEAEHGIGRFRDIGHSVGIARLNQAGGACLDDFDGDGRFDLLMTAWDAAGSMNFYRNRGDGTFEPNDDPTQRGGLNVTQADYDNDGDLDVFIVRGAWMPHPIRPSLLRNDGKGKFTDVTAAAKVVEPVNSNSAAWADFDNDGWIDLFVCCEQQPCRLYRNLGDGTFANVALAAGVEANGGYWKGATWLDFDRDRYPDLFLNNLSGPARFYRNNGDGTFTDASRERGIDGPIGGFGCWAWDYDNDGDEDIFATSYNRTLGDVARGLMGQPHTSYPNKLFENVDGKQFRDVTKAAGLDSVFVAMGCNFGDFDGDGYLDFYLGTGDPNLSTLVPNRMFRNLGGARFAEITKSSGTGHLQKGHGVACGDWDRDGDVDLFIETGGAINGDKYHNVLFQNPGGHGNHWLSVKLIGRKSNRAAIGARIKVVTAGGKPLTVHRTVNSGGSFGASPLEQFIGLGKADRVAMVEVHWPTSNTTQRFRDVPADRVIEVTEGEADYRVRP